jgi:S1-C subfamily serine protease
MIHFPAGATAKATIKDSPTMSEASAGWFVRSQGRILGPFAMSQLESMRDRGQLSKFHELSKDKRVWISASSVEGLFAGGPARTTVKAEPSLTNAPLSTPPPGDWFYNDGKGTQGPMGADQILARARAGQIREDTPIWREGFPCWVALRDVSELAHLLCAAVGPGKGMAPPTLAKSVATTFRSRWSRPLVISAAVILTMLAAATFVLIAKDRNRELGLPKTIVPRAVVERSSIAKDRNSESGPPKTIVPRAVVEISNCVDSHMSKHIPGATGLVVLGLTITDLQTGDIFEAPSSQGTCFAMNPRGYLVTNRHVVEEYVKLSRADDKLAGWEKTKSLRVKPHLWVFFSKERYDAKVIYASGKFDVAVLKVNREGPYFRLASRPSIIQGTHIYALGFPAASSQSLSIEGAMQREARKLSENVESVLDESDFRYSITDGIVSLVRNEAGSEYVQHSAEISGGNSGGPLIYDDGSVLGINTLVTFDEKQPGVGVKYYAISLNQAIAELRRNVPELFSE